MVGARDGRGHGFGGKRCLRGGRCDDADLAAPPLYTSEELYVSWRCCRYRNSNIYLIWHWTFGASPFCIAEGRQSQDCTNNDNGNKPFALFPFESEERQNVLDSPNK